jgi:hypothetical protein
MKREWRIRRALLGTADGQRRWDRAYQDLLAWTCPDGAAPTMVVGEGVGKERTDACRDLRTGIDAAAGAGADD